MKRLSLLAHKSAPCSWRRTAYFVVYLVVSFWHKNGTQFLKPKLFTGRKLGNGIYTAYGTFTAQKQVINNYRLYSVITNDHTFDFYYIYFQSLTNY